MTILKKVLPTTSFEMWLNAVELETPEEVRALYESVKKMIGTGLFMALPLRGKSEGCIVTATHVDGPLILKTEKAKKYFFAFLIDNYSDGDSDIEGWCEYSLAIAKAN